MNDISSPDRTVSPAKPYPRYCAECANTAVQKTTISFTAKVKHDGKLYEFLIPQLVIDQCDHCGEQFFTNSTDEQISRELRQKVGLLQPEEIRQQLDALELTQREFSEHLRVAQESVSRWLTGTSIQSRSLDTLMRLYFQLPNVRETLQVHDIQFNQWTRGDSSSQVVAVE
jgi:putative zinc finger/helix-turn-helix YgiT family protein